MTRRRRTKKMVRLSWHPRGHQARGVHLGKHIPVGLVHHLNQRANALLRLRQTTTSATHQEDSKEHASEEHKESAGRG